MPFSKAHYYILGFFVVTVIAFWPTYFNILGQAPIAHHIHGITATLWIALLVSQSWLAHQGNFQLHKPIGRYSMLLFVPFLIGGLLVTKTTVIEETMFRELFGIRLAFVDLISVLFFASCYCLALRNRKQPDLHARYMLATMFPLIGPSLARLFAFYSLGPSIFTAEGLPRFGTALDIAFTMILIFGLYLLYRDKKNNKPLTPFIAILVFNVLTFIGYYGIGKTLIWRDTILSYGSLSFTTISIIGILIGLAAIIIGWRKV